MGKVLADGGFKQRNVRSEKEIVINADGDINISSGDSVQGLTYIENGQYEKARNAFKKAAQEDPENVQAKETYQIVDKFLKAKEEIGRAHV